MASTYVAGVFLAISTYNGPQFVYHCYDESVLEDLTYDEDSEDGSDGEIVWSDDSTSSDNEEESVVLPAAVGNGNSNTRYSISGSHKSSVQLSSGTESINSSKTPNELSSAPSIPSVPRMPPNAGSSHQASSSSPRLSASTVGTRSDDHTDSTSSNGNGTGNGNGRGSTSGPQNVRTASEPSGAIFGFEREFLAELLCPPQSMCNDRFSLAIDDCILVGIPIHILESGTWRALKAPRALSSSSPLRSTQDDLDTGRLAREDADTSRSRTASRSSSRVSSRSHSRSRSQTSSQRSSRSQSRSHSRSQSRSGSQSPQGPLPELPAMPTSHSESLLLPLVISGPLASSPKSSNGALDTELPNTTGLNDKTGIGSIVTEKDSPMRMFHVAFALIPPITEASLCEERIYRYILVPFIRMLRNEQASRNYVWEEVAKMQKAREETRGLCLDKQQQAIEEASELARALKNLFRAIAHMNIARVMVNNKACAFQIPLQLELSQLPNQFDKISPHAYLTTSNSTTKEIKHDSLGSYGLLLLDDPAAIVQDIEVDPQSPVAAMIRSIDPTSSVEQIAEQNKIDIDQIVSLVWSLVYWRRARIIIPLSHRHIYGVSPLAPIGTRFKELTVKFRALFPMMPPLPRLLSNLSAGKPKPYMFQVPSADHRGIYMRALAWLLQNDFVIHLPTFALISVTRKIKLAAANSDERDEDASESAIDGEEARETEAREFKPRRHSSYRMEIDEIQDSLIEDPRKASAREKKWLAQIAVSGATRNGELAALFQRLMKYCNGMDCLEQIMIHENVSRVEMRRLLQEFNQYIVTFRHW